MNAQHVSVASEPSNHAPAKPFSASKPHVQGIPSFAISACPPTTPARVSGGCAGWPEPICGCHRIDAPSMVLMQAAPRATSAPPASAQASRHGSPARSPARPHEISEPGRVFGSEPFGHNIQRHERLSWTPAQASKRATRATASYPSPRFISTRCRPALPRAFHSDNCRCRSSAVKVSRRLSRSSL